MVDMLTKLLLKDFKEKMLTKDFSESTTNNYISEVRTFYKWYQEIDISNDLKKVTYYHLGAYKDYLIHNQKKEASSINRSIHALKNFFQFMLGEKLLKKNPSEQIKFLRSKFYQAKS